MVTQVPQPPRPTPQLPPSAWGREMQKDAADFAQLQFATPSSGTSAAVRECTEVRVHVEAESSASISAAKVGTSWEERCKPTENSKERGKSKDVDVAIAEADQLAAKQ